MKLIDELITAINNIRKEIEDAEKRSLNVTNVREHEKLEEELQALYRKLRFAAQDLERFAAFK